MRSPEYIKELVQHHVGGYLKIAPEHTEAGPLSKMMKPGMGAYERFKDIGLTEDEVRRFDNGIAGFSSRWEMSLPDFEADEYEESPPK